MKISGDVRRERNLRWDSFAITLNGKVTDKRYKVPCSKLELSIEEKEKIRVEEKEKIKVDKNIMEEK